MQARARLLRGLGAVLALVALGLALAFAIQSGVLSALMPQPKRPEVAMPLPTQVTGSEAHYSGLDNSGQPYDIAARTGVQDKDVASLIHLEEVASTFRRPAGEAIAIAAPRGRYDTKARQMELEGGVTIHDGSRFTAITDRAKVGVDDKTIQSTSPVTVTLPQGQITANEMNVGAEGSRILFRGAVKARFGTTTANKGDKTP